MMTGQWLCEQMYTLEMHTEVCGGVEREGVTLSGICFRQFLKNKVIDETDMENFFITWFSVVDVWDFTFLINEKNVIEKKRSGGTIGSIFKDSLVGYLLLLL